MNALISPNETVVDPNTKLVIGTRVAEVAETSFEVAPPLFWITCSSEVKADWWYYDPADQQIKLVPEIIVPEPESPV